MLNIANYYTLIDSPNTTAITKNDGQLCLNRYIASHELINTCEFLLIDSLSFIDYKNDWLNILFDEQYREFREPDANNDCCDYSCIEDVVISLRLEL